MCALKKIELISKRLILSSTKTSEDPSLATKITLQKDMEKNFQGWEKAGILLPWGNTCHPMPPHNYTPF